MPDPWLLIANRSFQDMRDVADRERLIRSASTDGQGRLLATIRRLVRFVPAAAIDRPGIGGRALEYDHPARDVDGQLVLVEATDRASARLVREDASRLVDVQPVHATSSLARMLSAHR